jgi:hypothetical protein
MNVSDESAKLIEQIVEIVQAATDFTRTESGLLVPVAKPEPPKETEPEVRDGFPVKAGWSFSKCGPRYNQSREDTFRMKALEDLYTAVDPGGGRIEHPRDVSDRKKCERLLNELAVALVGGIPAGCEEYT